jgi:endonuclease/exonuclease/phosphatase family metal-dependent hydrolase
MAMKIAPLPVTESPSPAGRPFTNDDGAMPLKVATYNLECSRNAEKLTDSIVFMANSGVTVFCLQEVSKPQNKEYIIDRFLERLGENWQACEHLGNDNNGTSMSGNAIIWDSRRLGLDKVHKVSLPKLQRLAPHEWLFDRIVGGAGQVSQRRAVSARFSFQDRQLCVSSLHLDHVGGISQRKKQLRYFLDAGENCQASVICGDFNTLDLRKTGDEAKAIQGIMGRAYIDAAKSIPWTADIARMDMPNSRLTKYILRKLNFHVARKLDYIWVKGLDIVACEKINVEGSDHLPVVATVTFN